MTTSTDVVNQALNLIGDNDKPVTGVAPNFDNSTAGKAAAILYGPAVQTVARQFGFDFSRNTVLLTETGNTPFLWPFEYFYPPNGIEIRQLFPQVIADPNNPIPVNWDVCNTLVGTNQVKVIQTDVPAACAVYTNQPNENTWDPLFREAVVRLLASEFAMALQGRPDSTAFMLQSGAEFSQIAQSRQD